MGRGVFPLAAVVVAVALEYVSDGLGWPWSARGLLMGLAVGVGALLMVTRGGDPLAGDGRDKRTRRCLRGHAR